MKNQTGIVGKQYQELNKIYKFDKKEGKEPIKKEKKMIIKNQQLRNMNDQI